jgi:hypothetical protein
MTGITSTLTGVPEKGPFQAKRAVALSWASTLGITVEDAPIRAPDASRTNTTAVKVSSGVGDVFERVASTRGASGEPRNTVLDTVGMVRGSAPIENQWMVSGLNETKTVIVPSA